jgi:hypothetical protein
MARPELQADSEDREAELMRELNAYNRKGQANELGERLYALAANPLGPLRIEDMAVATDRTAADVQGVIDEFRNADLMHKQARAADLIRRPSSALA